METMNEEKLIKYLLQESDSSETKAIQEWIESDPANQKQFEEIKWVWDSSKEILSKSEVDENAAWRRFKLVRDEKQASKTQQNQRFLRSNFFRSAAAIALIFISAWVYSTFLPQSGKAYFGSVELRSASSPLEIPLLDGTTLTLNKNTSLSYSQRFYSNQRTVKLDKGEVFFDVARNENKPFIVQNQKVQITVLGTSFHVKTDGNFTQVIVETGAVQVEINGKKEILKPAEKLVINQQTGSMEKGTPENSLYNYYVSNKFQANRTPLEDLVKMLNEAYGSKIEIRREELKKLPITTTLEYGSLNKNLDVIRETLNLKIVLTDGKTIIE
ncbi:FecR family protein [Algoriphagus resistens]|uniref:FecR family protein n=1 Tax=Algoriphagus resistens TaxID=1750590 RepID=UPI000716AA56|nr:FecR domain-containing protein [Algoriphagus resistens]